MNKNNKKTVKIKRDNNISIKVTDDELALIHFYASKKPHNSVADYVRDKALKYHTRTLEIKDEDLERLRTTFSKTKTMGTVISEEEKRKMKIADQFLEIMNNLSPLIADNGYVNYKDGGKFLVELKRIL